MSTDYLPLERIPYAKIKDLDIDGIQIQQAEDPPHPLDEACVLTNGRDYLRARAASNGGTTFTRYGMNDADSILDKLGEHFGTDFVSEHDELFNQLVDEQYRDDFITIQLPTPENPGPWRQIWPVKDEEGD